MNLAVSVPCPASLLLPESPVMATTRWETQRHAPELTAVQQRAPALAASSSALSCLAVILPVRWAPSPFYRSGAWRAHVTCPEMETTLLSLLAWKRYKHGGVCPLVEGQDIGGVLPTRTQVTSIHRRGDKVTTAAILVLPGFSSFKLL